jgi:hypothetical protein
MPAIDSQIALPPEDQVDSAAGVPVFSTVLDRELERRSRAQSEPPRAATTAITVQAGEIVLVVPNALPAHDRRAESISSWSLAIELRPMTSVGY